MAQMCPECSEDNADDMQRCAVCGARLLAMLGRNTTLEGRYRVTRVLGHGGMGAVYLADDARITGRHVALKENRHTGSGGFQSEAGVMVGLRHPGLPSVSDQFTGPTGREYLVMDYVEGETLEDRVVRAGPLSEEEVGTLAEQLLDALVYLHGQSVIHRDIKPANIRLTPAGRPVLVDFGISKVHQPGQLTQTSARGVGSPGFAAIEQYGRGTDARSDLYSLGAVMYYALLGQIPPEAPDLVTGTPLPPPRTIRPDVSLAMQRLIFRAMAMNPAQRFGSAIEMRQALYAPNTTVSLQGEERVRPLPSVMLATILCAHCGQSNAAGEIYCQGCAYLLVANEPCPHCHRPTPSGARFCTQCGKGL